MKRRAAAALLLLLAGAFAALGAWQVERRAWKLKLIASVGARAHAAPVPAPRALGDDAYRRVSAAGVFDHARATLVQAVTERGPGFWLLTPLATRQGWTLLVNRGFIPDAAAPASRPPGQVNVTGLTRLSEPGGGFLRSNDPAANRWYSRDVQAIARARGLRNVAPYFIDADAAGPGYPVGGLTVIHFRNAHLLYALTWFAMAGLSLYGLTRVVRER